MNHLDAFHKTVHGAPGGCEAIAPRMNMSAAILRNKANPNSATNKPTLDEADRLMGVTGVHDILHALAANHGYVCVRVEEGATAGDMAVLEMITQVWQTNGEVGTEINQALADGRITRAEVDRIREKVRRAECALESVVSRLEGMAQR
ncbi:phage regulatory CII family protein [Massilia sp. CMS3.1]|uniref:phage regulatory CII family protein n=1 Tax=Massilia sp. CMS3.1 TaxID=3373083 RepID=UPI003EE5BC55